MATLELWWSWQMCLGLTHIKFQNLFLNVTNRIKSLKSECLCVTIAVDISSLPDDYVPEILNDMELEYQQHYGWKGHNTKHKLEQSIFRLDKDQKIIRLEDATVNLKKVERWIKDSIIKRRIADYAVIQDTKEKNKITILHRHHGERLGIYHCRHCAMTFENEMQLSAHQRMHFFM